MSGKIMEEKLDLSYIAKSFRLFIKFNKYILRYWKVELLLVILGNFSVILSLVNPYIGKNVLDKGILAKNAKIFVIFTILGAGVYAVNLFVGNLNRYLKNYVIRKVKVDFTRDVFKKIKQCSLRFFQDRSTGGHIFILSHDITAASNIINDTLPGIVMAILRLILTTAVIIMINWKILILIMACLLLQSFQFNLFLNKSRRLFKENLQRSENIFKRLNDIFSHIYIVKAFGAMGKEIKKYFHDLIEMIRIEIKQTRLSVASDALSAISDKLFFAIIGIYGSFLVIKGELTLGSLGAIILYINQGASAYSVLLGSAREVILNGISLERVDALLDMEIEIKEKDTAKDITLKEERIEFKNATFGYQKDKPVLDNLSFCIRSDAHIAIVGPSGCGKTTLINLILRLYDVNKGAILLDGHDIREIKFISIYSQIATAAQQPFLWDDTIRNNIAYAQEKASLDEVVEAARIAEAHNFILGLEKGYDTVIGENACKISEGQKQRIAIARAVIKKPKILILDEAMSSLDSEIEDKIIDSIKKEFKNSTVIVVSHRLSTVKKMGLVYFLENPSTMDIGTHTNLLLQNQKYRDLFASQIEESALDYERKA